MYVKAALVLALVTWFVAAPVRPQLNADSGRLEEPREISRQRATEKFNQALVRGNTEFALNLYHTLPEKEGNFFF